MTNYDKMLNAIEAEYPNVHPIDFAGTAEGVDVLIFQTEHEHANTLYRSVRAAMAIDGAVRTTIIVRQTTERVGVAT